ncbi:MAG: ATP synthase subunit I [Deltaproteobacteria bacterium]|nr:ATP synthase subunit I [Deltaproteobacteria bacterium]
MAQTDNTGDFPIWRVEKLNWLIAALLGTVAALTLPFYTAKSVFIGGILANISYLLLKRDLHNFLEGKLIRAGKAEQAKHRFYLKYYIRLSGLALIIFWLISRHIVHPVGFLVGSSAIVLSIGITMLTVVRQFYFPGRKRLAHKS